MLASRSVRNLRGVSVSSGPRPPVEQTRAERRAEQGVKSNARLTASNAAVLLVLLAAEGVTILRVRQLVTPHVFIGMLLIPPVLVKIGSTGYRFARWPPVTGSAVPGGTSGERAAGSG